MQFEVDFQSVGEGEKSGDAIAMRFAPDLSRAPEGQSVIVIDGGTQDAGERLVEHIRKFYRTNTVNLALSTHPDSDHVCGLKVVLEQMEVHQLAMHLPWKYAAQVRELLDDDRCTVRGVRTKIEEALGTARELADIAQSQRVPIIEPFAGAGGFNGALSVLGPSADYYRSLLPQFLEGPPPKLDSAMLFRMFVLKQTERSPFLGSGLFDLGVTAKREDDVTYVAETWHVETLTHDGETSPRNNSSVILLANIAGQKILFTGDAGIPALGHAVSFAGSYGIRLDDLNVLHVPHHGSRRNVSPALLNAIRARTAVISASKDGAPKHPSKKVTNALIRRGATVLATQGTSVCVPCIVPRPGWGPISPITFHENVEA